MSKTKWVKGRNAKGNTIWIPTIVYSLGIKCHRCKHNEATTYYGSSRRYPVCEHCDKMWNDEFDREYQ